MKEYNPKEIRFIVNGKRVTVKAHPLTRLLDVLREDLKLTGVKEGCGEGECGACSVLLNGRLVNSCIIPVGSVDGMEVETIEGYRKSKKYSVIEDSFAEESAVQCGFCTPGFVMAAEALLSKNPAPTEAEIREGISGNLCRCTGYDPIVKGIKRASEKGKGLW
ncbi:MAG: (2Fe-2S)-binding protein [Spirochaetes bacterium]|nr:(2Fe-2S)-binding protein [Spirochaetota bacterium]